MRNSQLERAIKELRKLHFHVVEIEQIDGVRCFEIYRSDTNIIKPCFTAPEVISNLKYFMNGLYVNNAKKFVKMEEHRTTRSKERSNLQPLRGDIDGDLENYDDYTERLTPTNSSDIWSYD